MKMAPITEATETKNALTHNSIRRGTRHILAGISALHNVEAPTERDLQWARLLLADLDRVVAILEMRRARQ